MSARALEEAGFDSQVVAAVFQSLDGIVADHGVAIPWAIESGSRAWGFPSPDSDYDCRFFFVRPLSAYVDPWPPRDVIELPIDGLLDLNGWDLLKAVRLAENGNATVAEWLRSPLVYRGDSDFRDDLLALCAEVVDLHGLGRHYLHVGRDHWQRSGAADGRAVPLKPVFYALRPAATLAWLAEHRSPLPPMNLQELLAEVRIGDDVRSAIEALVEAKGRTRELGVGVVADGLRAWITRQFDEAVAYDETRPRADRRPLAAERFRAMVERWAPSA